MIRVFHAPLWLLTFFAFCGASVAAAPLAPVSPGDVYDPFRAHAIHIKLSIEGWDLLQPGAGVQKAGAATNREQGTANGARGTGTRRERMVIPARW